MSPGSLLLGNAGQHFECGHEHGTGDHCISFGFESDYFARLAADAGIRAAKPHFRAVRIPPLRALSRLVARASAGLARSTDVPWEELGIQLAAQTIQLAAGLPSDAGAAPPSATARVTRAIRTIELDAETKLPLESLAKEAGLSPYHFLRTFHYLTGLTPHKYILRTRLREAAIRLTSTSAKVIDIALDCGFGDISNFNRAFRSEFGVTPQLYRQNCRYFAGFRSRPK
jgi:AraC-like DNA-binding protein